MGAHSRLAPSSAHRWVYCTGSIEMQARWPEPADKDRTAAEEGTASHWIAEYIIKQRYAGNPTPPASEFVGKPCPENGVEWDIYMYDGALLFAETVLAEVIRHTDHRLYVEVRQALSVIHALCFGTPDAVIWTPHTLYVFDYKYGRTGVRAFENWQGMCYALGFPLPPNIVITIVQPRANDHLGDIRTWSLTQERLLEGYLPRLQAAAAQALSPQAMLQPGRHCRYCSARPHCPAAQQATEESIQWINSRLARSAQIPLEDLSHEVITLRDVNERVANRLSTTEEETLERMRRGESGSVLDIGHSRSRSQWRVPDEEVIALGDMLGVNLRSTAKALTPTQASHLLPPEVLKAYSERKPGSAKLIELNPKEFFND